MTATIELIQEATPRGEYKPTTLDELKAKADILVTAIDSHYEIVVKNPSIKLNGRGIIYSPAPNPRLPISCM